MRWYFTIILEKDLTFISLHLLLNPMFPNPSFRTVFSDDSLTFTASTIILATFSKINWSIQLPVFTMAKNDTGCIGRCWQRTVSWEGTTLKKHLTCLKKDWSLYFCNTIWIMENFQEKCRRWQSHKKILWLVVVKKKWHWFIGTILWNDTWNIKTSRKVMYSSQNV